MQVRCHSSITTQTTAGGKQFAILRVRQRSPSPGQAALGARWCALVSRRAPCEFHLLPGAKHYLDDATAPPFVSAVLAFLAAHVDALEPEELHFSRRAGRLSDESKALASEPSVPASAAADEPAPEDATDWSVTAAVGEWRKLTPTRVNKVRE
jgi:hypothetical protein